MGIAGVLVVVFIIVLLTGFAIALINLLMKLDEKTREREEKMERREREDD